MESWELLQIKLFNEPTFPSELCEVGEQIARECQGIPLPVILAAGVLTKKEEKLQKDEEIPFSNLAWLWTVEGFVLNTEAKSIELVAESLLNDLIDRSLIMVNKKSVGCANKLLGIKGNVESMPSWISNLSNLEVLLVTTVGSGTILPMSIWNMPRLKHVHVQPVASFDERIPRKSTNICCIETLAIVSLTNKLAAFMIKKATKLRKLNCHCKEPLQLKLDALQLESLSVNGMILEFSLPSTLTNLTLSDVLLPQSEISKIGRLPNLVVLKLEHRTFEEKNWDIEDDEFPTLKEIPSAIRENLNLKMIEVKRCSESLEKSVKEIKEEQEGYGNEELKVSDSSLFALSPQLVHSTSKKCFFAAQRQKAVIERRWRHRASA
ncbi:putative late blight resistance protein homolog R1A-10 [Lycium barbarum]|uniref:putative late blight resistance protein homolog R1A-10 n=1 Tax=Lycium barbarum TaxID=112863 RepID=UPI00293F4705|nr:putative late blight resistance protein homolog R1A-10 [Lycium barbarum]